VQEDKDLDAMMDSSGGAFGCAGPRDVVRPKRVDDPPAVDPAVRDAALREAGIDPAYLTEAPRLQRLVFGAALSMKRNQPEVAIRQQQGACRVALELKLDVAHAICKITLASYLSGAQRRTEALDVLREAIAFCEERALAMQHAQALLATGMLWAVEKNFVESVRAFSDGGRVAERAGEVLLALECWRLAGQMSLYGKNETAAVQCFREAIRIAEGSDATTVQRSSAADSARALADMLRARGMNAQSQSLFDQADAMEAGQVGTRATEEAVIAQSGAAPT
jgi:tetratricopeptide (TPR) repeat protein